MVGKIKYSNFLSICILFSAFIFSQLIEASHLFEEDCHEQNCFICPNGGDDKFIASSSQKEDLNFNHLLSKNFINQIFGYPTSANTPIRAPPFYYLGTLNV